MLEKLLGPVASGWHYLPLGEVCERGGGEIQTGPFGSQLHAADYVPIGIPSIMPQNIGDNRIVEADIARITLADAQRLSRYRVRPGDIVYSRRGDVERRALIREHEDGWLCGTGCLRVRVGQGVADPVFAVYYLSHPAVREWIVRHAHGATMRNLNTSILSACPFVLPPLADQLAIASILGALDDKIDLNRRMNKSLEAMARAIFKDWFVDFGPTRAKMEGRAPYLAPEIWSLFPDLLDNEEKPQGWEKRSFGTMLIDNIGGDWGKELPDKEYDQPVCIIRGTDIPDLTGGGTGKVPTRYTTARKMAGRILNDYDIIIEVSGGSPTQPTGRSLMITRSILDRFPHPVLCASFCRRFRPKSTSLGILAAQHLAHLYSKGGTWEYQNQSTGIANFQTTHFLEAEQVTWPGERLCSQFTEQIEPLARASRRNEFIVLAATRDLLLPKLMSGEIRVKDAEKIVGGSAVSSGIAESHVEEAALAWLAELGYATANGLDIGPDGSTPERANYGDVLLLDRVRAAIAKLNPTLTAETRAEVLRKLLQAETPSLVEENRRLHRYMIEGVPVEVTPRWTAPSAASRSGLSTSTTPTPMTGWRSTSSP